MRTGAESPRDPAGQQVDDGIRPIQRGFERTLGASRLLVLIPVVVLLLTAAGTFVYTANTFIKNIRVFTGDTSHPGSRLGLFLVMLDVFLTGVTLMIAAFGLYELFVINDAPGSGRSGLPRWLQMHDLDDLKIRVVSMLIIVAAITFIDQLVEFHDELTALYMGAGVAMVIIALTVFLRFGHPPSR